MTMFKVVKTMWFVVVFGLCIASSQLLTATAAPPQDPIAGGTESSATTVEGAMSEILRKPEVFEKAREELDKLIGKKRWVEENDIPNLPYFQAIVKETMRMHPVAPLLAPRMVREDTKIDGYDIRKGSAALVNVWTIGREPKLWENPNEFYPERFIGKAIDVNGQSFELLPFGSATWVFTWKLPNEMKRDELNMEEIFGLSKPRKFPLKAVSEARLSHHLYAIGN